MSKRKFDNFALYLLFFANAVYASKHGFNWLFWLSATLTAICLGFDIWELIHGRKK